MTSRESKRESKRAGAHRMRKRPGGRTERNRQKVAAAVTQLIREGRLEFELQEVAALAGIHRTTLFRRWPDRGSLFAEAMAEHVSHFSIVLTGDWKKDLRCIAFAMRDFLNDPVEMAMNRMLAITDNEDFREQMLRYWTPIIEMLRAPIVKARAAGRISRDVDPVVLLRMLIPPILVEAIFLRTPATDEFVNLLVDQMIRGCRR